MRPCSKELETKAMEIDDKIFNKHQLNEEPRLSGAYIRSLVKQLTSSKTKETTTSPTNSSVDSEQTSFTKFGEGNTQKSTQQQQQQQQHKKQVRRRLHTTRPYQERLLNMAEARREIVTALKFHRASMKKQQQEEENKQVHHNDNHYQQVVPIVEPNSQINPCYETEGRIKSRRNPRIYPTNISNNFSNYIENLPYNSNFCQQYNPTSTQTQNPFYPITNNLSVSDNLNFPPLPDQTLGLNLNFHDFNNIETAPYQKSNNNPLFYSTSIAYPSSSSSQTLSVLNDQQVSGSVSISQNEAILGTSTLASDGLHAAMDDEEMKEIRSIGEQYQMEWNDNMNLVTSAWWFKFLKSMELGVPDVKSEEEDGKYINDGFQPFDQVMEFPSWLNVNDTNFQQHFHDYSSDDYFQSSALPSMDIGEIEGMDGDWLA